MKESTILLLVLSWLCWNCSTPEKAPEIKKNSRPSSKYLRWVGDSKFDAELDDSTFTLCHNEYQVKQYFNMENGLLYQGEKKALKEYFFTQYRPVAVAQSGWIRIRFIVNCEGKTGRFRMIEANTDYQPLAFDNEITDQLMSLTQSLNGWLPQYDQGRAEDYYQYLIFKIEAGHLIELLP